MHIYLGKQTLSFSTFSLPFVLFKSCVQIISHVESLPVVVISLGVALFCSAVSVMITRAWKVHKWMTLAHR